MQLSHLGTFTMSIQRISTGSAILAVLTILGGVASVLGAPLLVRPHLAVESADLHGVVLFSDGETPVTRLGVRVWDSENERSVYRTQTSEEGVFSVPRLSGGRYFLIVGELSIDMEVLVGQEADGPQQSHDIVVVIPRRVLVGMPGYQDTPLLLSPLLQSGGSSSVLPTPPVEPPTDEPPTFLTPVPDPPPERVTSP